MARGVGDVYVLIVWGCDWDCASDYHDVLGVDCGCYLPWQGMVTVDGLRTGS